MSHRNVLKKCGLAFVLCLVPLSVCPEAAQEQEGLPTERGNLVIVADATMSQASYSFELPQGWMPVLNGQVLKRTNETGFWMGGHPGDNVMLEINPNEKSEKWGLNNVEDYIEATKEENIPAAHCSPDAMTEYPNFKPSLRYPYKVQEMSNCPQSTYGLVVFVDLPKHVVMFNLYGRGADDGVLTPHLKDFEHVLATFTWTLK